MAEIEAAQRARSVAAACAYCVSAVACIVLLGWVLDVPNMKGMFGTITMKTNAAIGLLLCASGVWAHSRGYRRLGACSGAAAAIIGALTLSQHLFGWNLGIDELLFREPAGAAATASPNRMGPNASSSLMLAGTALVLLSSGSAAAVRYAQAFATTAMCLATLAVAGYIYGAAELYAVARYTGIALHTAVALIVLNIGVAATRIEEGPLAVFVADGPAGTLLRRLAGPIVVLPLALGFVTLKGRELALYDRGLSLALFAVLLIIVFAAVVWRTAATIAAADASRRAAEHDRDDLLVREREARAAAERASRLKDQFIAVLSHELRTPLNVMLGWTHVLETERSFDRHARAAGIVARNGRMLARLVEDLLDVSRVSAGQFEIDRRPVAFNAIVQTSVDALTPLAREKVVALTSRLDGRITIVDGDPERLQQIVANLLSNAIKFTAAGGHVDVTTALDGDRLVLTVADDGIGFDESFASQLFQPFRQADSSFKREYGGLGLGLSIARHIAELHGGSIAGASAGPGKGATFTLSLPVASASLSASGDAASIVTSADAAAGASGSPLPT